VGVGEVVGVGEEVGVAPKDEVGEGVGKEEGVGEEVHVGDAVMVELRERVGEGVEVGEIVGEREGERHSSMRILPFPLSDTSKRSYQTAKATGELKLDKRAGPSENPGPPPTAQSPVPATVDTFLGREAL